MKHPSRLALVLLALALPPLAATAVADDTILLVNGHYTDGEPTELGPVGYSSFEAAQAAVTDKANTTIRGTVEDDGVEKPEFTADIVTKDYRTEFVGREGERLDLQGVGIVVGDSAADVERADVSISHVDNINEIRFGNVTGTASLVIDHAGSDEDPGIGCLDLTGSCIADLKVAVGNSFVATMKLPDQEPAVAEVTVRNTAIASLEGSGSSSLTVLDEDYPSTGRYVLAENAEAFSGVVIVRGADGESASLSIGGPFAAQWGKSYSLALSGGRLVLVVRPPAIPVAYFDPRPDMPRDAVTNGFPYAGEACLDAGWYVVTGAVRVAGRIAVCDDANLVLADGAELVAEKGIGVNDLFDGVENSLSIWAQGTNASAGRLTATAPGNAAAIGGDESCGTVRVYGGRISAVGGEGGAGIGSGSGTVENGPGFGGAVYVYGGTVEARGGAGAAGIGLGFRGSEGEVFVYGGDVTAVGGGNPPPDEGAPFVSDGPLVDTGVGIGGSDVGVFIGHESAFGCTVVATGGAGAAGIYGYPVEIVDDATVTAESGAGDQPLPAILSAEDIYIGEGLVILEPPGGRMSNERPFIVSGDDGEERIATRVVIGPPPPPTPLLAVTIEDVFYSQTVLVDVDLGYDSATGAVTVAVGGTNFTETVTGRLARVEMAGFDAGEYEASVEFVSASPDLTDATTNAMFTVWKTDSAIEIVDIKDAYLKGETIEFLLRPSGSTGAVTVAINGEPCEDDVFDRDALKVSIPYGLETDEYVVEVFLEGDANHNGSSDTKTFVVVCRTAEMVDVAAEQTAPGEPTVRLAFTLQVPVDDNNSSPTHESYFDAHYYPDWNPAYLSVMATNPATGAVFLSAPGSLSGHTAEDGRHEVVWDMSGLLPEGFGAEGMVFTVAWLNMPDWCVLDLSGGTDATNAPVSYLDAPPDGGFASDPYLTTNLVMRLLPAGTYRMGGTNKVEIERPFYCAVFETTQRQWELVTGGTPSEHEGATRPVESVSYADVRDGDASFLGILRRKSGLAALDLPTGTQWEYACRAGTTNLYNVGYNCFGSPFEDDLKLIGRYDGNRTDGRGGFAQHTAAGSYQRNPWGLYDMHGNVREWCQDGASAWGGGWNSPAGDCTSSSRASYDPATASDDLGFRLVRLLPDDAQTERLGERFDPAARPGALCSGTTSLDVAVWRHFATGDVVLADYEAAYDEAAHGIGVATNAIDGLVLRYAARPAGDAGDALAFSAEMPLFTDVTNATIWVEATAPGYFPATNAATVVITPATPLLAVSIPDATYPEILHATVDVGFDVAGSVTVSVGGTNFAGTVSGGRATVDLADLGAGSNQVARVEFVSGSPNVTGAATNAMFNIDKAESTLQISVQSGPVSAVGEDVLIWLTATGSRGDISVFINGKSFAVDNYEIAIPGDLDAGDYLVEAFLDADANYNATNATAMFKVVSLAAEITDVRTVQTAPWIPKATLSFSLSATLDRRYRPSWNEPCLSVTAYDPATGATYVASPERLSGDTNAVEGAHSVIWDMSDVLPEGFVSDGLAFTVSYLRMPEFCVLDLSGGADATNIPVSYLDAPPASGWTAADKTTNLVLRLLPPWSFTMGRENVAGNPPHEVALERPFYCAVFETTQRQWELATGGNPSYHAGRPDSAMRPVEQVSYDDIRGATEGAEWPASGAVDEDSFLGILRRKTGLAALDLPSEAQWEYAGRAGMAILDTVQVNSTYEVGLDAPNAWILCGMHGNVWEWCLDRHGDLASGAATDPVGPAAGTNRVLRGGGYAESERDNTLSDRRGDAPSRIRPDYGFRLVRNLAGDTRAERAGEIAAGAARAGTLCSGTATAALDCSPSPWKLLQAALAAGEDVVLTNDVACDDQSLGPLVVPAGVTASLDLNGHTVDRALAAPVQNGRVFVVETNGTLAISDSAGGGVVTGGNTIGDVAAGDDGDLGGRGGGAFVAAGGSLTMTGGMFATNTAWGGGAICALGSLRVTGSAFVGNEANSVIYIDGTNAVVSFSAFAGSSRLIFFSTNPPALYDGDSHSDTTILPPVNDNWFGAFGSRSDFKPSVGGFGGYLCNMTRWCFLKIEREIDEITGKCRLKATPCIYDMALAEHILEISDPADYRLPPIPLRCIATDAVFDGATATNPATIRLSREGYTTAAFEPRTDEGNGYRYTVGVVVPWDETLAETLTFERSIAVGAGGALDYTFPADYAVAAFDGTNGLPAVVLAGKTVSVALDGIAGAFSATVSSNGTFRLDLGDAVPDGNYAATFSIPGFKPAETTLAVAIPPKYTLVYDAGGGSGEMESRTIYEGETFAFPDCAFRAPAGKGGFDHWKMSGVDGVFQNGGTVEISDNCAQNGTITVTAYWKKGPPPFVANVRARQRWPWNGLVDVDYEVGGDPDDLRGLAAEISFVEQGGEGRAWVATNFLAGAEPSAEPGFHRATWDTAADGATNVVAAKVTATVELVREPPVSDGNVWSLIGDFNSWGGDVDMTLTDGKWVSPVTKITAGGFKIRFNHDWTENVGGVMEALGIPFAAISGGDNISIEEGNDYVVTYDPDDQTILVEFIGWGVVGAINSWGGSADLAMKEENGMFVRKNVTLAAHDEIKVRYRNSWDVNYGGRTDVGFAVKAISGGDNLKPGAGTYDIWLDAEKKALFVMEAGDAPEYWGVFGTINGWGGTPDAVMYHDAEGYFVAKGITLAAGDEIKIRKNSDWTDNRGASDAAPDTALDAVSGGDSIKVAAGTYDVYYQSASEKIYVMTAGKTPADAQ